MAQREAGGRGPDPAQYPTQQRSRTISPEEYHTIISALDTAAFWALPDTIGCPDCADGGSCFITVNAGGRERTVTYDCPESLGANEPFREKIWALAEGMRWE